MPVTQGCGALRLALGYFLATPDGVAFHSCSPHFSPSPARWRFTTNVLVTAVAGHAEPLRDEWMLSLPALDVQLPGTAVMARVALGYFLATPDGVAFHSMLFVLLSKPFVAAIHDKCAHDKSGWASAATSR
jgi:hypothetical protein